MMTDKIICPECGAENPEDAVFCEECHASLEIESPPSSQDPVQSDLGDFDLLSAADDDLPGLLHALKQEDETPAVDDERKEGSSFEPEDLFDTDQHPEGEDIPDWLHRIRQRASEEDDSVGEITQKISAAKESLAGEKRSTQHESFESWIKKLRGPVGNVQEEESTADEFAEDLKEEPEEVNPKEPDWLQKIRKAEGKLDTGDLEQPTDEEESDYLNWLVTLEDEEEEKSDKEVETTEEDSETLDENEQPIEIDDAGVTQEVEIEEDAPFKAIPPKIKVTPEEQIQADKLASLIMDENAPRPVRKIKRRSPLGAARFFFAILLVISVSVSLFLGQSGPTQTPAIQPHTEGFINWTEEITENSSLLLVFDYQPAFSSEINLMAVPILEKLADEESKISVISSSLSGPFLYRQLFQQVGGLDNSSVADLGYFPVGAYAAFGLRMGFSSNWIIPGLPESYKHLPTDGFDGVLIFADTYEGAKGWIEQLTILLPETPINLLVADQAMPMLMPYFDSGQITGMVSGFNGGTILEAELSQGYQTTVRWWAYQVGLLLLMFVIVIGAIYAGNQNKEEGGEA